MAKLQGLERLCRHMNRLAILISWKIFLLAFSLASIIFIFGWLLGFTSTFFAVLAVTGPMAIATIYVLAELQRRTVRIQRAEIKRLEERITSKLINTTVDIENAAQLAAQFSSVRIPISGYSMRPTNMRAILDLIERMHPELVVELGSGASTLFFALALKRIGRGRIVSFEHDENWADMTRHYVEDASLNNVCEIRVVELSKTAKFSRGMAWYNLENQADDLDGIDLLVVDGPPSTIGATCRLPALEAFHHRLTEDAVVVLDDANRRGEQEVINCWTAEYPDMLTHKTGSTTASCILRRR